MGAERQISKLDTSTWPQEHGGQDFHSQMYLFNLPTFHSEWIHGTSETKVYCPSHQYANLPSLHKNQERISIVNSHWSSCKSSTMFLPCFRSAYGRWSVLDTLLKSSCSGRMTQCLDNLYRNFHWHRSTNKHHTISVLGISKSQITKLSKWLPGYIINVRVLHILCNHVWDTCCDVSNLLLELVPFWHIAICMAQISGVTKNIIVVDVLDKCIRSIH